MAKKLTFVLLPTTKRLSGVRESEKLVKRYYGKKYDRVFFTNKIHVSRLPQSLVGDRKKLESALSDISGRPDLIALKKGDTPKFIEAKYHGVLSYPQLRWILAHLNEFPVDLVFCEENVDSLIQVSFGADLGLVKTYQQKLDEISSEKDKLSGEVDRFKNEIKRLKRKKWILPNLLMCLNDLEKARKYLEEWLG